MRKFGAVIVCLTLMFVYGCAGLNYNEVAPNAANFQPKNVVILPLKMPEGMNFEENVLNDVVTDGVRSTGSFVSVIDPATTKNRMASDKALQDAVVSYLSKMMLLGVSDKDLSAQIAKAYSVDTFITADISRYGYLTYSGNNFGEVSMSIKLIDAQSGTVLWKAGHSTQEQYAFFKPDLGDMARELSKYIFAFLPTKR